MSNGNRWAALALVNLLACGGSKAPSAREPAAQPATAVEAEKSAEALAYPLTRRVDVVEDFHGTRVADPYRWLEDQGGEELNAWVEAQNQVTFGYLESLPAREPIRRRLQSVWNYAKESAPVKRGGRYFFGRNEGLQPQAVLYWKPALTAEPQVLLDPNTWSKDGTVALSGVSISHDGKRIAYAVADAGSDWKTWRVREVATGKDYEERVQWSKFTGAAWTRDGNGFVYGRYEQPAEGTALSQVNSNQKLYFHRVGTPQSADVLVFETPSEPQWMFGPEVTDDGRYLVVSVSRDSSQETLVYVADLQTPRARRALSGKVAGAAKGPANPLALSPLVDEWRDSYELIGSRGRTLWFLTTKDAPRGRIAAVELGKSLAKPRATAWQELVPETAATLRDAEHIGGAIVAHYLEDAHAKLVIYTASGQPRGEVALPAHGTVTGFNGNPDEPELFFEFESYLSPSTVYLHDLTGDTSTVLHQPNVEFDAAAYVTEQVFYQSKDGTRIPMYLSHKKGMRLDGTNPTYLYGYGGFNIAITPKFSPALQVWMEMGGLVAVANLRGGGEYGQAWYDAGRKLAKQNVFDDFIAAAEWLIENRYTSPRKLGILGGSNGGLLVGAAMTQRPELFAAAIPQVGVLDMVRFHKFTIGWAWTSDYGSSDNPEEFAALYAYSPYHNVKEGSEYPATLVVTSDHDDRVVPAHSYKFAAALQAAQRGLNPVLLRIETRAGHGAGKPTELQIAENADILAFLAAALDVAVPPW